jgi:hypothetical protein
MPDGVHPLTGVLHNDIHNFIATLQAIFKAKD